MRSPTREAIRSSRLSGASSAASCFASARTSVRASPAEALDLVEGTLQTLGLDRLEQVKSKLTRFVSSLSIDKQQQLNRALAYALQLDR